MYLCPCERHPLLCIVPPYMLEHMASSDDARVRKLAVEAIESSATGRAVRSVLREMPAMTAMVAPTGKKQRLVYDAQGNGLSALPGRLVRAEGQAKVADPAVDEAYDHSGSTYDFYLKRFKRNSLDGAGMALVSSVHVGRKLNNAFWNGQQMAYGDGDGSIFVRFTKSLDVVGHELTHGVIAHECNLVYRDEPGALNEHFADVFGLLVRQWKKKESAAASNWLIGKDIMGTGTTARALRDFGPGKAYANDPMLGTDPQPKHMRDKFTGTSDNGGVHLNSGIPNHAFYLFARALGGQAWDVPGAIWYRAMKMLSSNSGFEDMVATTGMIAVAGHGVGSKVHKALTDAWQGVGL